MKQYGYAGEIVKVDLTERKITKLPSADYTNVYLGGRGVAVKLYWEMVPAHVKAFDPENALVCTNGPLTGFNGFASNRWQVCAKSPTNVPETFSYANLGGSWGAKLKMAGFDGIIVQGKADRPVYIWVNNGNVEIRDAAHLWGKSTYDTSDTLKAELGKATAVFTMGQAGENLVTFATVTTDDLASGSGGLGAVMGSKLLKAIAVAGEQKTDAANPDELLRLRNKIKSMRARTYSVASPWGIEGVTKMINCYGCGMGCSRHWYRHDGKLYKSFCQAACVFLQSEGDHFPGMGETQRLATRLCDQYGLDTSVMMGIYGWLVTCYQKGILTEEMTGLPISRPGSAELAAAVPAKIAFREGFGDILARGTIEAAKTVGKEAELLLSDWIATKAGDTKDYDPRLIPTSILFYATEPRRPIQQLHEPSMQLMTWLKWKRGDEDGFFTSEDLFGVAETFWGGRVAADFTTYEGKALAAKLIQDRSYAKECLILCDFNWPMMWTDTAKDSHVGDPTLESQLISAVTGKEFTEASLNAIGEKVYNLQRAIFLRDGWRGRQDDQLLDYYYEQPLHEGEIYFSLNCEVMGPDGEIISQVGQILEHEKVELLKSEYYSLRGWDADGLPTASKLKELGLTYVTDDLAGRGIIKK